MFGTTVGLMKSRWLQCDFVEAPKCSFCKITVVHRDYGDFMKLSILCFRHEEQHSPETPKPEIIDHCLLEELVQSESKDPDVTKRDWRSILPKV
ncbi:hypothetical protein L195_g045280, partial [Trifolium pratense]